MARRSRGSSSLSSPRKVRKGTGLGLSTVFGMVKQSGGHFASTVSRRRGTAFRAYFPRVDGREDTATVLDALSCHGWVGTETILLVEDEVNLLRLARQYLETQGYKILEAADGAAALQIVDGYTGTIDLLLTDVIMPGMNGRELAAQIAKLIPDLRVLYMSGYTENAVGHDGTLDAGINLLQKPFSLPVLKDRVREVLDSEPVPMEVAMSYRTGTSREKRKFRHFARAGSIYSSLCAIARLGRKAGARGRLRTSAAPGYCSRRKSCSI